MLQCNIALNIIKLENKMTNFKIDGKHYESKKGHYVVTREHERAEHNEIVRLEKKLDKHIGLPMEKAHHAESSQKEAPLPNMRSY